MAKSEERRLRFIISTYYEIRAENNKTAIRSKFGP